MRVAKTKIERNTEWGEYIVRAYDKNGRRMPEADYYTGGLDVESKLDAINTAAQMTHNRTREKGEN